MDWVQELDAPLQLFLTRIASISLSRNGASRLSCIGAFGMMKLVR